MKKNLLTLSFITLMFSSAIVSCDDDDNDDVVLPVTDTTTTDTTVTTTDTSTTVVATQKYVITFEGINDTISVDSGTVLKDVALPTDNEDRKILKLSFNGEPLSQSILENTVVDKDLSIVVDIIKLPKQPTLQQLKAHNYTAVRKYFDFSEMKAYTVDWDDENTFTYVSDITFDESTSTISFKDEYTNYTYPLYFLGENLNRRTGIFTKVEGEDANSFYGKYDGVNAYGESITVEIKEDGSWIETSAEGSEESEYKIEDYTIKVKNFYDYYYDGKNVITLKNYFEVTNSSKPTIDKTQSK